MKILKVKTLSCCSAVYSLSSPRLLHPIILGVIVHVGAVVNAVSPVTKLVPTGLGGSVSSQIGFQWCSVGKAQLSRALMPAGAPSVIWGSETDGNGPTSSSAQGEYLTVDLIVSNISTPFTFGGTFKIQIFFIGNNMMNP